MLNEKPQDDISNFFETHLKSYVEFEQQWMDIVARLLIKLFGSIWFLNATIVFIFAWIGINLGWVPGVQPFDPYPFVLLMMLVSFAAAFLAVVVLIGQNRLGRMADIRQRIDFEVNVRAEYEITKILTMLEALHVKAGIAKADTELDKMKEKISIAKLKEDIEVGLEKEDVIKPRKQRRAAP